MTPEERLAYLLESVFVPTNVGVTIAAIEDALVGMPGASDAVVATFTAAQQPAESTVAAIAKAGRMQSAFIAMSSEKGLLLSTLERQAVIDELAVVGAWPDAVRDAVKALGGEYRPRWQAEGYISSPTVEDFQKEDAINAARTSVNSRTTAINAWLDALDIGAMTVAEVEAYISNLLASEDGNPQ